MLYRKLVCLERLAYFEKSLICNEEGKKKAKTEKRRLNWSGQKEDSLSS